MFAPLRRPGRLLVAVLCASLASAFLGASAPPSTAPTLVLFPFREAAGLDPRYGSDYVTKVAGVLTAAAQVKVVMGDPATAQADYLHATKVAGGDYYLTGFVAPPVNGTMAVIEQIVSARSGTAVWSNTAHIANEDDILNQGPVVQKALLTYAMRGYFAILNPTPKPVAPSPTPAPKKKAVAVPSGGGGGVGGRASKAPLPLPNEAYGFSSKPTAPPKVYASANRPTRFVVLAITGKTAPPVIRDYTASSLMIALSRHGQTTAQGDPETTQFPGVRGHTICLDTAAGYLVFGTVSTKSSDATTGDDLWTQANLDVYVYDCARQKFEKATTPAHGEAFNWKTAVDHATDAAVTEYLLKVSAAAHA